jgi:calcineurin-like phosphoesterase family protein
MSFLFTADLHLSDNPSEEYRWSLIDFLIGEINKRSVSDLFVLGDLTNKKDNHSGKFVTRLVSALLSLSEVAKVHLLKGNHDYTDPESPFFGFTSDLGDGRIRYYSHPTQISVKNSYIVLLPHTRNPEVDWKEVKFRGIDLVLIHQCIKGALSENGMTMDGLPTDYFRKASDSTQILAGDIHVPQTIGGVEYIGAPYPIHFGDSFKPRILFMKGGKRTEIYPPSIRRFKVKVSTPEKLLDIETDPGDHIKVVLSISRSQFHEWDRLKKEITEICSEKKVVLFGIELKERKRISLKATENPKDVITKTDGEMFDAFCDGRADVDKFTRSVGKELIGG